MPEIEVPVLIVGGSLVGMSTALLLAHHGVRALAVENHRGTAIHPRAAQISQRTMEIFRTVGVERIVREKSDEQFVQDGAILAVETLAGKEIQRFIANLNEGVTDVSPCRRCFISQSLLEPLLKARVQELGGELLFGTEMVSFEQDADGVTAVIRDRDTGQTKIVRAQYMVAADGARSGVRQQLGIRMAGHGTFSKSITIYFRADLEPLMRDRNMTVIYVFNPVLRGFFRIEKPFQSGFLAVNIANDLGHPVTDVSTGLSEERSLQFVRAALGRDDIPITIENVMHWDSAADMAERFQVGRVLLAGDAAHVMPPNGGFGGNTGVQDAHNLAWKLALVAKGKAGPDLLSTYEPERRPASALTVEQAYTRYVVRVAPDLPADQHQALVNDLNIEMGYIYRSSAIIPEDANDDRVHENPRESKGRPGTRAPHVWLKRDDKEISTLDLFGGNVVLLAGVDSNALCDAARSAAEDVGIELDVHRVGEVGLTDPVADLASAYGIDRAGAVLVRPDGFVAWRLKNGENESAKQMKHVLLKLFSRSPAEFPV
ncbi:MAG TPA: FAD-dependent monooxygenase [Bryobacteraceae bacterium]|nr:FAD-dependent monooxygenase [Bryobacteraceae bacterium]